MRESTRLANLGTSPIKRAPRACLEDDAFDFETAFMSLQDIPEQERAIYGAYATGRVLTPSSPAIFATRRGGSELIGCARSHASPEEFVATIATSPAEE